MPNRTSPSLLKVYKEVPQILLTSRAFVPSINASTTKSPKNSRIFCIRLTLTSNSPPLAVSNATPRSVQSVQHRLGFSPKLWDRLLDQAPITLNLLRGSRVTPTLSAQAQLQRAFDFNHTPLNPQGTRMFIHEFPNKRGTWSPHAFFSFYTGSATKHYRCYKVWVLDNGSMNALQTHYYGSQHKFHHHTRPQLTLPTLPPPQLNTYFMPWGKTTPRHH